MTALGSICVLGLASLGLSGHVPGLGEQRRGIVENAMNRTAHADPTYLRHSAIEVRGPVREWRFHGVPAALNAFINR